MEFAGEGAHNLSINDRMVLCNLAVEAGAKSGIVEPDEKVVDYVKAHGRHVEHMYVSDQDANYAKVYHYDLSKIKPVVARPDFVDDVIPLDELEPVKIDQAFLGSCNNGRIDDLRVAAEILKRHTVKEGVRFIVAPASNAVYLQALEEGILDILMEAGAQIMNANCSVCWGSCQGVIGENEVLVSTGTRNFKGRAGHPSSKVYLASAETVTRAAVTGYIQG
jgi:3-isopropylmalate/(R)-2-methylmalate dehydratase large subunit